MSSFAKKAVPRLTSWSYSRYSDWRSCPLKCKLKHIDRIKEPGSPAMERGNQIHKDAEAYIKGQTAKLAPDLALFKDEFKTLRALYKKKALPVVVEDNWAFTAGWDQTRWDDWAHCWVRIKLDCAHHVADNAMVVTDWKSGRMREEKNVEYTEQLELYALSALLIHDWLEQVEVRLGWTDAGAFWPEAPMVFTRADVGKLKKEWNKRVKPMMSATSFPPKANKDCRWCFYGQAGKAKGGPGLCKF